MNCLILGATGLIGRHTIDRMLEAGHSVRAMARTPRGYAPMPQAVQCHWADWHHGPSLARALEGMDVVVHLICPIRPQRPGGGAPEDARRLLRQESAITERMLELCRKTGPSRVVFLSSGGTVYGVSDEAPIPETHPTRPISDYGRIKLATEKCIARVAETNGLEYLILRGANGYGEYQDPMRNQGVVNVFLRQLARNSPIEIWGGLQTVRDYLYAGDMARAIERAAASPVTGEILNVGSGRGVALETLLQMIKTVTGTSPVLIQRAARMDDVPENTLDVAKIERVLGWRPEVNLESGIARTWRWIRALERSPFQAAGGA